MNKIESLSLSEIFALNLLALRTEKKWTQEHLAELIDMDRRCIQTIECLERVPSIEKAGKIADALGVTLCSMLIVAYTQAERAVDLLNGRLYEHCWDGLASETILRDNGFYFITETLAPDHDTPDKFTMRIIVNTFADGTRCGLVLKDTAREVWSVLY